MRYHYIYSEEGLLIPVHKGHYVSSSNHDASLKHIKICENPRKKTRRKMEGTTISSSADPTANHA